MGWSSRSLSSLSSSAVKQVSKANFSLAFAEIKERILDADFVAVCSQKTGASSAPWCRILSIDISETAYLKAKAAAERFELLQFAVCPFKIQGSKIIASPYNFHLFPRDEMSIGMPSYSFSCQTSYLTSMAREGFDFNVCIYDGISYLSRVQESMAKGLIRNPVATICQANSMSSLSVADTIFMKRIKSRVQHWIDAYQNSNKDIDDALIKSLRKIILDTELYGSRPCMNIDVCNDRQVQLVVKILSEFSDNLVPLIISEKGGEPKSVRIVLTSSEEDSILLKSELQNLEEEQGKQVRGFRAVLDLISASRKPVVGYNCLHDFTLIHSKFLAPLPPNMTEFMCSMRMVFTNVIDIAHLFKYIGPLKNAKSLPAAANCLSRHFIPLEMEILHEESHGSHLMERKHDILKITDIFAKASSILNISSNKTALVQDARPFEDYANIFYPCSNCLNDDLDENAGGMETIRKVRTDCLVFLWGFHQGISAKAFKSSLSGIHSVFSEGFDLRLVDESCAVVVFRRSGLVELLLEDMVSGILSVSSPLREMMSEGLKAAGYGLYVKACNLGLWEETLADSLDRALIESSCTDNSEVYCSDELINIGNL